jgi:hypothetical protein
MITPISHNGKAALAYAKTGYFVFPCSAERKKREDGDRLPFGKADKSPILVDSWSAEASRDETKIRRWWSQRPEALIGLPCKQNRLLVIDADRHTDAENGVAEFAALCEGQDEPMPAHPAIITDYEGEHHIFRMPDEPLGNRKIGVGIETRGYRPDNDGGYIIAPGSRMPDERGWSRMNGTPSLLRDPLPLPPQWLIDLCRPPKIKPRDPSNAVTSKAEEAYAMAALNRAAAELAQMTPNSGRDNKLLSIAGTMGRMIAPGWIGQATVEGRLLDACRSNGLASETGAGEILDKIRRGVEATLCNPHSPLPERPKANGKDHTAQPVHDWDDPDWSILDDRRGDLPAFPLAVFSPAMRALIIRTSEGAGVTPAHVAVPLIGVVSGLIGCARRVKVTKSWMQATTCWTVIVGFSGTGKTPGLNVVRRALKQIERDSREKEKERERKHETKKIAAKAALKIWNAKVEEAAEKDLPAPVMPEAADDPGKFIPLRLCVTDATIERLSDLLQLGRMASSWFAMSCRRCSPI